MFHHHVSIDIWKELYFHNEIPSFWIGTYLFMGKFMKYHCVYLIILLNWKSLLGLSFMVKSSLVKRKLFKMSVKNSNQMPYPFDKMI